ncbi:hypothetical protein NMY22_g13567 [Coprinellus aureogranulatus]|nr:hypothetical protein NMY22_g13567 [Coprinellus aureogranulatus]
MLTPGSSPYAILRLATALPPSPLYSFPLSALPHSMSRYAPLGWTINESVDVRNLAMELLRVIDERGNIPEWQNDTWAYWMYVNGIAEPDDWESVDLQEYIDEFKARVFRVIRWHAFRGRFAPSNHHARMRRIREIRGTIIADVVRYRREEANFNALRPEPVGHWFDDTLHGYTLEELRSRDT